MIDELWKDIEGYEGLYKVSNIGRIRSVERYVNNKGTFSGKYLVKAKIRKLVPDVKGYLKIRLSDINGKIKTYYTHRLVALAFIDNLNNKPEVNHIDRCKTNNCIDNLEWSTSKENSEHYQRTK